MECVGQSRTNMVFQVGGSRGRMLTNSPFIKIGLKYLNRNILINLGKKLRFTILEVRLKSQKKSKIVNSVQFKELP